ncbi:hypothetical protein CVT24_007870 [Panaeolus cyanescens]|uniref:C3H1-type domain-containing protein n=1 Tax=Panaeolus cyanescens TaxID=181874 RepID=A0A409VCG6_9AGAR|nr:hypothetical protein CVT24_007870 [Panaeolus cyanescens]
MASSTEAQIRNEIERLTATINQHKARSSNPKRGGYAPYPSYHGAYPRSNTYVNPNYRPANKYIRPGLTVDGKTPTPASTSAPATSATSSNISPVAGPSTSTIDSSVKPLSSSGKKEVVLGGVAFESSGRSLVRKDLPKPVKPPSAAKSIAPKPFGRKPGHIPPNRLYKPKGRRGRNMTLNNTRRPFSSRKTSVRKTVDKPCPRFTTTGACSRGLTCMYQHDPTKIAICWNFLQDNCSNSAETCNLSHDPTPERTPLCMHFLNKGRCTREKCPFPHVNVGQRDGVCRDFAVLGYCEKGLDCDRQHVRECPDFAEKGTCGTKGCKLPHVIRANRSRKVAASSENKAASAGGTTLSSAEDKMDASSEVVTAPQGEIGDEYISLTFHESDSDSEEESEEESGSEEEEEEGSSADESESEDKDSMEGIQVHKSGMQSTFEESTANSQLPQFRQPDPVSSRPTIEQIAMGLHISRTPHLRPLGSSTYSFPPRHPNNYSSNPYDLHNHRSTPITLPPPPSRSSMKKPSATVVTSSSSSPALSPPFSHQSGSSTTMTSITPSSTNPPRPFSAIKSRMARFLPRSASMSATSTMVSTLDSPRSSTSVPPQKKAVRFTTDDAEA